MGSGDDFPSPLRAFPVPFLPAAVRPNWQLAKGNFPRRSPLSSFPPLSPTHGPSTAASQQGNRESIFGVTSSCWLSPFASAITSLLVQVSAPPPPVFLPPLLFAHTTLPRCPHPWPLRVLVRGVKPLSCPKLLLSTNPFFPLSFLRFFGCGSTTRVLGHRVNASPPASFSSFLFFHDVSSFNEEEPTGA